jgi:hypothetical protein
VKAKKRHHRAPSESDDLERSTSVRFAISIPQFVADGMFDPAGFRAYLERAEELGFDRAWTME